MQKLQPQKHQKIRKTKGVQEQEKRLRTTHYYVQKKKIGNQEKHDVTTTSGKTKLKKLQKFIPTDDAPA